MSSATNAAGGADEPHAASPDAADELAALFVSVTGEETLTERQHCEYPVRVATRDGDGDVSGYVSAAMRADGLDDAIAPPDER